MGGGEGLTSFFVPGEIDSAFRDNSWCVAEMVEVLTDIIRDKTTRRVERRDGSVVEEPITSVRERMAAITMLDRKAKEAMILGGLIQKDRLTAKKTTGDGTEIEYNAEGMRLTEEGSSRLKSTLALLEGASKAKGDEIIDMEVDDASTTRNESSNIRSNGASRRGPSDGSLLPRQPRGSSDGIEPVGPDTGDKSRSIGCGGNDICGELHGVERSDATETYWEGPDYDEGPTGGAEDERESGISEQLGGSGEGKDLGGEGSEHRGGNLPNPESPRRPVVPGEAGVKRVHWYEPGIPRRSPDSDAGSIRDCQTAESALDRLQRIERAREQAAAAAAGYLERRAKNQRSSRSLPGESNEPRPGDGGPRATPDSA